MVDAPSLWVRYRNSTNVPEPKCLSTFGVDSIGHAKVYPITTGDLCTADRIVGVSLSIWGTTSIVAAIGLIFAGTFKRKTS